MKITWAVSREVICSDFPFETMSWASLLRVETRGTDIQVGKLLGGHYNNQMENKDGLKCTKGNERNKIHRNITRMDLVRGRVGLCAFLYSPKFL